MIRIRVIVLIILAVMLGVFAGTAKAAPPTRPICYPLVKGTSAPIFPRYLAGEVADHFYFFCVDATGKIVVEGMSCMKGTCKDQLVQSLLNGTSKITRANAAWDTNVRYRCDAEIEKENTDRGRLCTERKKIYLSDIAGK
jgi:hypothetical protein